MLFLFRHGPVPAFAGVNFVRATCSSIVPREVARPSRAITIKRSALLMFPHHQIVNLIIAPFHIVVVSS